jgi:hypothetical protein
MTTLRTSKVDEAYKRTQQMVADKLVRANKHMLRAAHPGPGTAAAAACCRTRPGATCRL